MLPCIIHVPKNPTARIFFFPCGHFLLLLRKSSDLCSTYIGMPWQPVSPVRIFSQSRSEGLGLGRRKRNYIPHLGRGSHIKAERGKIYTCLFPTTYICKSYVDLSLLESSTTMWGWRCLQEGGKSIVHHQIENKHKKGPKHRNQKKYYNYKKCPTKPSFNSSPLLFFSSFFNKITLGKIWLVVLPNI